MAFPKFTQWLTLLFSLLFFLKKEEEEDRENPNSPWSQLPTDLLELISQTLAGDFSDFIRFRSVCRSWRYAAKPSHLSRAQLPWLLLPYDPQSSIRSFFNFATESTRSLLLPETRNQNICGLSNGWLLMLDKTLNVSLFNPLTRALLRLPPITSLAGDSRGFRFRRGSAIVRRRVDEVTLEDTIDFFDFYAFISSDAEPVDSRVDGVVAFVVAESSKIHYCRLRDAEWTTVDSGLRGSVAALAFHKHKFYFVDSDGRTAVCELGSAEKQVTVVVIPPVELALCLPYHYSSHFLVAFGGELMLVTGHKDYLNDNYFVFDEMVFEYHKLEEETMTWSRIEGVGNCSVFVTDGRTQSRGRLMAVASDAPGYKENCLYYAVPPRFCRKGLSLMHVLVVDEGDVERYYGPWTEMEPMPMSSTWIVPSLR